MLTAVASARYRLRETRVWLGATAAILAAAALGAQGLPISSTVTPTAPPIADRLEAATWAMTIPFSWLAAPAPHARAGDAFDVLAIRPGDRAVAAPVAYAVMLLATDERGLTVQVDEDDAVAIASARGSGMQFIVLLRSVR